MILMDKSLYWKLTLAFMLVAFITAGLVAVLIRSTSADRLSQLIIDQQRDSLEQALVNYYIINGSWNGVENNWRQIQYQTTVTDEDLYESEHSYDRDGYKPERRAMFGLTDAGGMVLVSISRDYPKGSHLPVHKLEKAVAVEVNGEVVGRILVSANQPDLYPAETLFLERTNQALYIAMMGAMLVALTLGILLARTLTRPIRALTHAAQNITRGQLEQQVPVNSQDEIGQLGEAFNRMSLEVSRVNQLRRQLTADIAHDLRTPLTVIGGYVESMRDGVLQPTPQRLSLIYAEIERLQRMVNDLRMLSQADAGELSLSLQSISPGELLSHAAELFHHNAEQRKIRLVVDKHENVPDIFVDEARIMQIMDNLISNALRYTPAGGQVTFSVKVVNGKVDITIQDTGTGIAEDDLPNIFNRFHRVDKSRHSETGESGLGLAIVKALVEAQQGRVWAESELGHGTTIHLEFPIGVTA